MTLIQVVYFFPILKIICIRRNTFLFELQCGCQSSQNALHQYTAPPDGSQVQGCSRKKQKTPWVQTQFDSRKIAHIPFLRFQRHFLASLLQYTLLPSKAAIAPTKIPVFCKCSQHEPKTSDCVYKKHIFLPLFTCCFGIHQNIAEKVDKKNPYILQTQSVRIVS